MIYKTLFILIILALFLIGCASQQETPENTLPIDPPDKEETPSPTPPEEEHEEEKPIFQVLDEVTIDVTMERFSFHPNPIVVKQGQEVTLRITSLDVTHGFHIADLDLSSGPLNKGEVKELTFIAETHGTYTIQCSVFCGSGHSGMRGALIIEAT